MARDLIIFEAVHRTGGVRCAAKELYLSPASVTRSIYRLEEKLNEKLFIKKGIGISSTESGDRLFGLIKENVLNMKKAYLKEWKGCNELKISISPFFKINDIQSLYDQIGEQHKYQSKLTIDSHIIDREETEEALRKMKVDVLISPYQSDSYLIESKLILVDEWCMVAAKNQTLELFHKGLHNFSIMKWCDNSDLMSDVNLSISTGDGMKMNTNDISSFEDSILNNGMVGIAPLSYATQKGLKHFKINTDDKFHVYMSYNKEHTKTNQRLDMFVKSNLLIDNLSFK